jgi:nucleoside-diphosphate-sugar epimerase
MSVLITGGAGFVGAHLADKLLCDGQQVTIVDNFERGDSDDIKTVRDHENCRVVRADLCERNVAFDVISGHSNVYHLAAKIGGVGYLRDQPADIISANDQMNRNVFDASVEADIDRLVFAGSSMVYSESDTFPHSEDDVGMIPPPAGAYGFQKLNGEYYCEAYNAQYGLEYSTARIFNAVGPGDWPESEVGHGHVVPDLVRKIVEIRQDPVKLKGSGEQTRCFVDIRDLVDGLVRCMERTEATTEAINLGTTREVTIRELATVIWEHSDRPGEPAFETEQALEKDVQRRVPDITKAREVLGWEPEYSLEESIKQYLQAYTEVYHG